MTQNKREKSRVNLEPALTCRERSKPIDMCIEVTLCPALPLSRGSEIKSRMLDILGTRNTSDCVPSTYFLINFINISCCSTWPGPQSQSRRRRRPARGWGARGTPWGRATSSPAMATPGTGRRGWSCRTTQLTSYAHYTLRIFEEWKGVWSVCNLETNFNNRLTKSVAGIEKKYFLQFL